MSGKLAVDFEKMDAACSALATSKTKLEGIQKEIANKMSRLNAMRWDSPGKYAFFTAYAQTVNAKNDIAIEQLEHLRNNLQQAKEEYEKLYQEIPKLARSFE